MSGSPVIELWDRQTGTSPPVSVLSVIAPDETLFWAARVSGAATFVPFVGLGLGGLAVAVLVGLGLPWGVPLDVQCTGGAQYSCRKLVFVGRAALLVLPPAAIALIWFGFRDRAAPRVLAYGITSHRALVLDERNPKALRSVDLNRYPARLGRAGTVWFGPAKARQLAFARLGPSTAERAVHWANTGRRLTGQPLSPSEPARAAHV